MLGEIEPTRRYNHVAVHLANHIIVVGGKWGNEPEFQREIWRYNLCIGEWKRYDIPHNENVPPSLESACAVSLGLSIYMFGGYDYSERMYTNSMWRLNTTLEGRFVWSKIKSKHSSKEPSPRTQHSGWEYRDNLYIFGGFGSAIRGYLSEDGNFNTNPVGCNNQLLCFDPLTETWTNPKCSGSLPEHQSKLSSVRIRENVWFYGSCKNNLSTPLCVLFELNMHTRFWTVIQNGNQLPRFSIFSTLSAISDNQLLLHGGQSLEGVILSDTWILDLQSQTWREYSAYNKQQRHGHTCTTGINRGNCLIIGGSFSNFPFYYHEHEPPKGYRTISHIMLEPLSLQQLASRVIYKHKSNIRWNNLPPKLIFLLELSENVRNS